jgi:peptide/nickel transport system substrate-binding protein
VSPNPNDQEDIMSSIKSRWTRRVTLALLAIGGLFGALAVACGGDPEVVTVVETVVVDRPVTQIETVIETVVVERQVTQIEKVIETVVVEREVTRTEKVVETVVVEKVVEGQTVKVIETVIVDRPVTRTEKVIETVVVDRLVTRTEKVVETVVVEKPVTVTEKVVETVIVMQDVMVVATPTPIGMEPVSGGTVRWALDNNIATLDALKTTSQPEIGALHSQEKLFEFDETLTPQPSLVESWTTSDDGLTWTFKLREGITFNAPVEGRPFTSEHAMGNWKRWLARDNFGGILNGFIESIETPDDLTYVVTLSEPTGLLLDGFARLGGYSPYMMPPEMYAVDPDEGPGNGDFETFGGTGPYQLVQWRPGDRLLFTKWADYKSPSGPTSFLAGTRLAYADVLEAIVIPEEAARIAALETGAVDWIGTISGDQKERLEANPELYVFTDDSGPVRIGAWPNHVKGPMSDARVRRAIMIAFPKDDALLATAGDPALFRQCGSLMLCGTRWGGIRTPGDEIYYDPPDLEAAKALIEEAGYTGAKMTLLTRSGSAPSALVMREVVEDLGFEVDYQHVDAASYSERRSDTDRFDMFFTGGPVSWGGISPLLNSTLAKGKYWNKYQDPSGNFTAMLEEFARAPRERQDELIIEMQKLFYQDMQYIPFGEVLSVFAGSKALHGVEIRLLGSHTSFVNSWKDR